MDIEVLSSSELLKMKEACKLAAKMIDYLGQFVKEGVSTQDIDDMAVKFAKEHKAKNAPLGYHGFPKSICTSVNEVICHGIPSKNKILKNGDIVNVDVSPILNGFYADTSKMFLVGDVSLEAKKLVEVTYECLWKGINEVRPGNRIGDIGAAIQEHAEKNGFSVVRDFVGHGIGKVFHHPTLQIPHFGQKGQGRRLLEGMIFTIEPMINQGDFKSKILADKWTAVTIDGKLSAQWEHTVLVTDSSYEVLTLRDEELCTPFYRH